MFLLHRAELITEAWAGCPFLLGGLCNRKSTFRRGEVLVFKQPPRGHRQVLFQLRKNTKHTWPAFVLEKYTSMPPDYYFFDPYLRGPLGAAEPLGPTGPP